MRQPDFTASALLGACAILLGAFDGFGVGTDGFFCSKSRSLGMALLLTCYLSAAVLCCFLLLGCASCFHAGCARTSMARSRSWIPMSTPLHGQALASLMISRPACLTRLQATRIKSRTTLPIRRRATALMR